MEWRTRAIRSSSWAMASTLMSQKLGSLLLKQSPWFPWWRRWLSGCRPYQDRCGYPCRGDTVTLSDQPARGEPPSWIQANEPNGFCWSLSTESNKYTIFGALKIAIEWRQLIWNRKLLRPSGFARCGLAPSYGRYPGAALDVSSILTDYDGNLFLFAVQVNLGCDEKHRMPRTLLEFQIQTRSAGS